MALAAVLLPMLVLSAQAKPAAKSTTRKAAAEKAPAGVPMRFRVGATGNEARYRVRELLAAATVENDAVGATTALTGGLMIDASGKVDTAASKWTVDLTTLKSDRSMRDRYVQGRTLETAKFPTAALVITEIKGLPAVLPDSATLTLTLLGQFTVHGVTKPTSWDVTATVVGDHISGTATTHLKFAEYNMALPSVPVLANLVDDIKIEYDFHLIREHDAKP
jgi:polyisoprenoid-binding protein YceI